MMAGPSVHGCCVVFLLVLIVLTTVQSSTSFVRSLPTYNESSFNGGQFSTGGIQLLIPSLNFTCMGAVTEWSAHVTGDTSISDLIEFQIYKPDDVNDDLYHLIYGNPYDGNNVQGSVITRPVNSGMGPFIPIREGYILGVYLPPSVAGVLDLLYDNNGDTDIYYWENIDSRTCDYSLCSGKVKRNVNLLIGWNFVEGVITQLDTILNNILLGSNLSYCQGSISQCINDSIVVTSTTTLSSNLLSSSPIYSSFSIDDSTVSIPLSTITQVISTMSTTVGPSSTNNGSPLAAPELIAAIGVVLVLFVIILVSINTITIGVWYCLRRKFKPVVESSVAQGFDSNATEKVNDQCINEKENEEIEMFSNTLYNSVRATDDQITGIQYDVPFQSNPAYNAEIRPTNYISGLRKTPNTDGGENVTNNDERIYSEVDDNYLHII